MANNELSRRVDLALDREELESRLNQLGSQDAEGLSRAAIGGGSQLHPLVAAMATFADRILPSRHARRQAELIILLGRAVIRLGTAVDLDLMRSSEFEDRAEDIWEAASRRASDGKREYFAAA